MEEEAAFRIAAQALDACTEEVVNLDHFELRYTTEGLWMYEVKERGSNELYIGEISNT